MFSTEILESIKRHAKLEYPNESVGFVIGDEYVAAPNNHPTPDKAYKPSLDSWLRALNSGKLRAVVHSHPEGPDYPSADDMQSQQDGNVPHGIVVVKMSANGPHVTEIIWWGDTLPIPELVGRVFRHGISDCLNLIRDEYRLNRNIFLPNQPRNWLWWEEKDQNLYVDHYQKNGFRKIGQDEIKEGDIFLSQIKSSKPNHGGIYLGKGIILHHLMNKLSKREPIGGWAKYVTHWLRHEKNEEDNSARTSS
jgi:proteasome lid subunit RPN8/RPN11